MMDFKKIILYAVAAILGVMVWTSWKHDYPAPAVQTAHATGTTSATQGNQFVPSTFNANQAVAKDNKPGSSSAGVAPQNPNETHAVDMAQSHRWITVKTDLLQVMIDPNGGSLVGAYLTKYPVSVQQKNDPMQILNAASDKLYVAQSGLTNDGSNKQIQYTASQQHYVMNSGQDTLMVRLTGRTANGIAVVKTYTFVRGQYAVQMQYQLTNHANKAWTGSVYNQFVRRYVPVKHSFHSRSYYGGAISSAQVPYKQLPFAKLNEQNVSQNIQNGWIAMQQPYFLTAWVPRNKQINHYYSMVSGNGEKGEYNVFTLGYESPGITLKPGQTITNGSTFYVGPELAKQLEAVAPHLELTINYGWLAPISMAIFWLMAWIHGWCGNWGWSIVLVTVLIKIIFYPFSAKSLKSMAKLRELQPRFAALKERFGDDKQAMGKATMEIYKKEKVNPVSGCLPMIIQIPVFFSLYYVLIASVELRQAPFIFWIHDLSVKDPYYVLPILMGLSMFIQQKMNPAPPDPTQAKVMMFLPVIFTVFFLTFPAGLVLYWLTNNCVQSLHQFYVLKTFDSKKEKFKSKKGKRKR